MSGSAVNPVTAIDATARPTAPAGLADAVSGLIASLIRKLVAVSSVGTLTYIIVGLGVLSSIASDAGYLVLIPLGAVAFKSVGRNPLAGIAAAFAGVSAGFGVNFMIAPIDGVLTEITNDAIALVNPGETIDLVSNLWFGIGSTIFVTIVMTLITTRLVEPRLGPHRPELEAASEDDVEGPQVAPEDEARGLRWALWATVGVIALIAALTIPSGAPLRNPETSKVIGDSPFMDSLLVIITLLFFAAGLAYGRGARTVKSSTDVIDAITKSWAGLAGLLFFLPPAIGFPLILAILVLVMAGFGVVYGAMARRYTLTASIACQAAVSVCIWVLPHTLQAVGNL